MIATVEKVLARAHKVLQDLKIRKQHALSFSATSSASVVPQEGSILVQLLGLLFCIHSHYNSITEPRARFLLALLEHLTIDFPSHFNLSILDVYRDTATHDKLIFPSTITRILCRFLLLFPLPIIFLSCVP